MATSESGKCSGAHSDNASWLRAPYASGKTQGDLLVLFPGASRFPSTVFVYGHAGACRAVWKEKGHKSRPTIVAFRKYWSHVFNVAKRGSVCRKQHTQQSVLCGSVHKRRVSACKLDNIPRYVHPKKTFRVRRPFVIWGRGLHRGPRCGRRGHISNGSEPI